jgi:hypothetical protein
MYLCVFLSLLELYGGDYRSQLKDQSPDKSSCILETPPDEGII